MSVDSPPCPVADERYHAIVPHSECSILKIELVTITDAAGGIVDPEMLAAAEPVHRLLRPQLSADYPAFMSQVFAGGGRMLVAAVDGRPAGVAVYRVHVNTHCGLHLYVDDLVTDERQRSRGVGHALLSAMEQTARDLGCTLLALESGVQRDRAHRFYFREGMYISSFSFRKMLG